MSFFGFGDKMKGLTNFINEVLECQSKSQEVARVQKEMSNIKSYFSGKKSMNGYGRKKYVAKLLYIYLLGYSFDFGFPEMVELVASQVFSEKQIGYITLGVYLNGNYELITLFIEHFRKEIRNTENEPAQCLALAAAANIGGADLADSLSTVILQALRNPKNSDFVKKAACLALCRLYRERSSVILLDDTFVESLNQLLFSQNIGVQLSACSLILSLMPKYTQQLQDIVPTALGQLTKLIFDAMIPNEYVYGRNPAPWLVLKFMRIISYKLKWDDTEIKKINRVIDLFLEKTDVTLISKELNSNMILLLEAINLIIACRFDQAVMQRVATILGGFLSAKNSNVKYVALEMLTKLVQADPTIIPFLDSHRQTLYLALRDPDNSIRRRSLALLFAVCTKDSAEEIVHELLNYLRFADPTMREPLCLKIAVMAEQYAEDPAWFVDVVLQLISLAGDECSDAVWYRVVQVVSKIQTLQRYATITSLQSMCVSNPHDMLIALTAQLVGEYITMVDTRPEDVITQLLSKFRNGSETTKGIIVSSLAKIAAKYPPGRHVIVEFLESIKLSPILDVQQRAIEFLGILKSSPNVISDVFKPIPPFEKKSSALLQKVMEEHAIEDGIEHEEEDESADNDEQFVTRLPARSAEPVSVVRADVSKQSANNLLMGDLAPSTNSKNSKHDIGLDDLILSKSDEQTTATSALDLLDSLPPTKQTPITNSPERLFKNFLSSDNGLCFDDINISINLSIALNGLMAILSFNVQNKTAGVVTGVGIHIPPVPFLKIQSRPGANQINRGEMTVYQFAISVTQVYIDPPQYTFRYRWNEQLHNEMLKLPLPIFKFVNPFSMDHPIFFSRWGGLTAPNQIASSQITPTGDPITHMKQILTSVFKSPILQLQVPQNNVCGAGVISTEGGSLGILCRFYVENGLINVQIKGTTPQITAAVQKVLDALRE